MRTINIPNGVSLFVAIPAYDSKLFGDCAMGLINLAMSCQASGIKLEVSALYNSCILTWARNELVHKFLQTDCTHMLFLDSDIGFDAMDVFRMVAADKDLIGGIYPIKEINWSLVHEACTSGVPADQIHVYATNKLPTRFSQPVGHGDEPVEVDGVATGFMLIKRDVFTKLTKTLPSYTDEQGVTGVVDFFNTYIDEEGYMWSEDMNFCRLWMKAGGKVYAAPWTNLCHWGSHKFVGHHGGVMPWAKSKQTTLIDGGEKDAVVTS